MPMRESKQFFVGWLLFTLHAIGMIAAWIAAYAYELNAQANGVWTEGGWILIVFFAHLLSYVVLLAGCILMMLAVRKKRAPELPPALCALIRFSYFRIPLQWVLLQVSVMRFPWLPSDVRVLLYYSSLIVMLLCDLMNLVLGCVLFMRMKKARAGVRGEEA